MTDQADDLSPTIDPSGLRVHDFDVKGAVFVIPSDAPIPSELAEVEVPTGSLYARLGALDNADAGSDFAFVPVSGSELISLDRPWRSLQRAPRVYALFDIPGAKYDVLFTQAVRTIGLPRLEWPAVSEALASRVRVVQRARDKTPWKVAESVTNKAPRSTTAEDELAVPVSDELTDEDR